MFSLACKLTRTIARRDVSRTVQLAALAPLRKSAPRLSASGAKKGTGLAWVAQLVERVLGKDEVTGSIPVPGSRMSILVAADGKFWHRAGVTQR